MIEAFSPDRRSFVSSGDGGCCLRNVETGQVRATLHEAHDGLRVPRFSPDGKLIYAKVRSDEFKPVDVYDLKSWDVATGRTHGTIPYRGRDQQLHRPFSPLARRDEPRDPGQLRATPLLGQKAVVALSPWCR